MVAEEVDPPIELPFGLWGMKCHLLQIWNVVVHQSRNVVVHNLPKDSAHHHEGDGTDDRQIEEAHDSLRSDSSIPVGKT